MILFFQKLACVTKKKEVRLERRLKTNSGQALIEAVVTLPLLLILVCTFFVFVYEQMWNQITEHILHEAIICEKTLNSKLCMPTASMRASRYNLIGKTWIHKGKNEYRADLLIREKYQWKSIIIKTSTGRR